jgi:RHS repeat-associated protein
MNLPTSICMKLSATLMNSFLFFVLAIALLFVLPFAGGLRNEPVAAHTGPNSAPVAVNDGPYTVHGSLLLPQVMTNDSDPDGDSIVFDIIGTNPTHGNLSFGATPGVIQYNATQSGYVGPDSFTYRIGDTHGAKSNFATVSINVANQAPIAATDNYTVHGATMLLPHPKTNDTDPDGDNIIFDIIVTPPSHGNVTFPDGVNLRYTPSPPYIGPDSFTYRIKDSLGLTAIGTVNLNVVNQPPTPVTDNYTVHGPTMLLPHPKANDFDADGDSFVFDVVLTPPAHGNISFPDGVNLRYTPNPPSYVGSDSFTYRIRDSLGLNATGTVNLTVQNQAPVIVNDAYTIRGTSAQQLVPNVIANDFDPDGDSIIFDLVVQNPTHGSLGFGGGGVIFYTPQAGYSGTDKFTYKIADSLTQRSAVGTVTLYVIGDGERLGCEGCSATPARGPRFVGKPVDVTTGNMYLQQTDYELPGAGPRIRLQRIYNSQSTRTGLFGKGWSTVYDEALQVYDTNLIRLNEPDGRATYFGRPTGSSGVFLPLEADFRGQVTQTAGGYTLSFKNGSIHQFDSTGKLLSLTDRNANQTSLAYNVSGKLSSVTDSFGRTVSFVINLSGRVTSITDTTGTIADYSYGAGQELLTVTYADSSGYAFAYDGSLRLTTASDKLGNVLEAHTYDAQGRATMSEKHGGVEHYTLNYVSATETDVTDALTRVTKYFFDKTKARNVVTSVEGVCSCGGSQINSWTYDSSLNVTSATDGLNHTTSYTYDADGNVLTISDGTGAITFTYNSLGQMLTRTDQMSGITINTYSATGNLLTSKDALNNTTTFTYDSRGQILTVTDARNKVTTFTWGTNGQLTQITDALSQTTNFAYDARARLTTMTNALSQTVTYEYDAAGRPKKIIYPDTSFVLYTYDLAGRRTKVTDPRGNETNIVFDSAYRLTSVTDALSHATTYGYDLMSNLTAKTDALSRVTNYEYDDFNRVKKTIYPPAFSGSPRLEETITYDSAGNITKRTDTAGRDTTYAYDSVNRLTGITDPSLQVTQFQYNARSQQTQVSDALGQQYTFSYDPLGRTLQSTRAGTSKSYVYDAVGNLTQRTDYNGAITTYVYDDLNRLTTINYPDSTSATYDYDTLSRLTAATNPAGTVTFAYDSRNRVTSTTDVWGQTVGYSYDANGNRTELTLGGSAFTTYQYDAANRLTTLTDSSSQNFVYNYDVVNRLTSRLAPNLVTTSLTYDGLDRLLELAHAASSGTLELNQYDYNNASKLVSWDTSTESRSYAYDANDRLTSMLSAGGNETYGYNAVGSRTSSHLSGSYSYQPTNRLTATSSATYSYDNNGSLISKTSGGNTTQYAWDPEQRLKEVTLPTGNVITYKYDALGRRIERQTTAPAATTRFIYDRWDVVRDTDGSGTPTADYLNGLALDEKLRQTTSTGSLYFLTDHLGSTRLLSDSAGNIVEQSNYDSFGNSAGSALTRYGYTGRERDEDTGLLYYRARFYDPELGRFLSEDPLQFAAGDINLYVYVHNRPTSLIDPFGEQIRADAKWSKTEVEDARRLAEKVRSMSPCPGNSRPVLLCCRTTEVNAIVDFISWATGIGHCFIKTNNKEAGQGPAQGGPLPMSPLYTDTAIIDHTGQSKGAVCTPVCQANEECVDRELQTGKNTGPWSVTNNCWTVSKGILGKCSAPTVTAPATPQPPRRLTAWDKR